MANVRQALVPGVFSQYTVFGSSGAVVVTLATAALPVALNARSAA